MTQADIDLIMASWSQVGIRKAIGYLPLYTVERVLRLDRQWVNAYCLHRGLNFKVFEEGETCINGGAIYVWSTPHLQEILRSAHQSDQTERNTEDFIDRIASEWFDEEHALMPLIKLSFAD